MLRGLLSRDRGLSKFKSALERTYEGIVGYHGCRTEDVATYYRHGLMTSNHDRTDDFARQYFLSDQFPFVTRDRIEAAIANVDVFSNISLRHVGDHRCYLAVDERALLAVTGHYLIYGSERLFAIATRLGVDCVRALMQRGRPTIVVANIPICCASEHLLVDLAGKIREHRRGPIKGIPPPRIVTSIVLAESIRPSQIVSHQHPRRIPNPHEGYREYVWNA